MVYNDNPDRNIHRASWACDKHLKCFLWPVDEEYFWKSFMQLGMNLALCFKKEISFQWDPTWHKTFPKWGGGRGQAVVFGFVAILTIMIHLFSVLLAKRVSLWYPFNERHIFSNLNTVAGMSNYYFVSGKHKTMCLYIVHTVYICMYLLKSINM